MLRQPCFWLSNLKVDKGAVVPPLASEAVLLLAGRATTYSHKHGSRTWWYESGLWGCRRRPIEAPSVPAAAMLHRQPDALGSRRWCWPADLRRFPSSRRSWSRISDLVQHCAAAAMEGHVMGD